METEERRPDREPRLDCSVARSSTVCPPEQRGRTRPCFSASFGAQNWLPGSPERPLQDLALAVFLP